MRPPRALLAFLATSFKNGTTVYWTLLRITVPLLIAVRLLDEHFAIIAKTGALLAPLMGVVGLPGDAAIIFATALFLQIYAALLLLFSLWTQLDLTTAQVTILMTMILTAHALPVELRIVQKAGMPIHYALILRLGGAFALGALLNLAYGATYLQHPAVLAFTPPPAKDDWTTWATDQLRNWMIIFIIIQTLVLFINLLRVTHAERLLIILLAPPLRLLGIGKQAITMTMTGMLLGLSYGGALLIEQSRNGTINPRDALCTLSLLCLCHSIIEDTLLVMLAGAHLSGILYARLLFAFTVMITLNHLLPQPPNKCPPSTR